MTYRISSPTAMAEALSKLLLAKSILLRPLATAGFFPPTEGGSFLTLPALSNLPSESKYAGLNTSLLLEELLMLNNEFGTVSYMLPIEV